MARESPADRIARLIATTDAWERLRSDRSYSGLTLTQFKRAIKPSHDARAEIARLRKELEAAIESRERADFQSLRLLRRVRFAVLGEPESDAEFYRAMRHVRRPASSKRRRSRRNAARLPA